MTKRGQISTEYLIVVSFVTFVVLSILGIAVFYTTQIQDKVKFDEIDKSARKIVFAAETTFFDGEPAKSTIDVYLPVGITDISITNDNLVFTVDSDSGQNILAYKSSVPIQGSISPSSGLKKIQLTAGPSSVTIAEV